MAPGSSYWKGYTMALFQWVTDWLGLEMTPGDHLVQFPAESGSTKAGCTG